MSKKHSGVRIILKLVFVADDSQVLEGHTGHETGGDTLLCKRKAITPKDR